MKFVVLFEDNPSVDTDIRTKHMPEHLQFLLEHKTEIDAAGPLHNLDGSGAGGIWVVDVKTESEVMDLVETDPFWPTGLRSSVRVLSWTQVYANGKALIAL